MDEQEIIRLGIVGIKNMGEYDSQTKYKKLNVVTYQGSSYCALKNTVGNVPTNSEYWQLYAEKGDTGPQGPKPIKGTDYFTEEDILNVESDLQPTIASDVQSEVITQVGNISNGTPLVASSVSDMTDTTRLYVNTSDGYVYYYDGTQWVQGWVYQATEDSDKLDELYMKVLGGNEFNPDNILEDITMSEAESLDASTTITSSSDTPSNQININSISNTQVGASLPTDTIFAPMVADTYYLKFTALFEDNEQSNGELPYIDLYYYLNSNLKGSSRVYLNNSKKGEWVDYTLEKTFTGSSSNINNIHFLVQTKYNYKIKNFFILKGTDNDLGYYITYSSILESNKNVSIIGDSLSAVNETADKKWWYFLEKDDGYTIDNVAISGAGYFNGSNAGGTNNHQFYNQANNINYINSDIILIFGSFNDISKLYNGDVTIGNLRDNGTNTIYGCINTTINNILAHNPKAIIGAILPTPWNGMYAGNPEANPYKPIVDSYIECLKNAYEFNSIPYLDLYHNSNLRPWIASVRNELYYNADGVHPNNEGHYKYIYPHIKQFIKELDNSKYI